MRNIVDFRVVGSKGKEDVIALSNDGRLYLTAVGGKGIEWGPLPELPQEGFDVANTVEGQKSAPILEAITRLASIIPGFGGGVVDPNCPQHGEPRPPCGVCGAPAVFIADGDKARCAAHVIEEGASLVPRCTHPTSHGMVCGREWPCPEHAVASHG